MGEKMLIQGAVFAFMISQGSLVLTNLWVWKLKMGL